MKKREFLTLGGAVPLMLAGCGSGGGGSAQIRLLNASVGYSSLDLQVNNTSVTSGHVAYGAVSDYTSVSDGSQSTILVDTSTPTPTNLLTTTRTLTKDGKYTVIAYGYSGNPKTVQMTESQTAPATGFASFSVLNTALDVGPVDVYLTTNGDISTATAVAHNVSAVSQSAFTSVGAGNYFVTITAANNRTDVRLVASGVNLVDQQICSLVVVPGASGVLAQAILLTNSSTDTVILNGTVARVRVVPGLNDASGATVLISNNDPATLGGLQLSSSPDIGAYVMVQVGVPTITTSTGVTAPVVLDTTVTSTTLVAGSDYTVLVYNDMANTYGYGAGAPVAKLVLDLNTRPLTSTNFKFRLIHADSAEYSRDLTLNVASGVIAAVHFGQPSAYVETASVGATFAQLLENITVIYTQAVTTAASYVYTMFAFSTPGTGEVAAYFWPDRGGQ
jgi:hypothetical protein